MKRVFETLFRPSGRHAGSALVMASTFALLVASVTADWDPNHEAAADDVAAEAVGDRDAEEREEQLPDENAILAFVRAQLPDLLPELIRLRTNRPDEYEEELNELAHMIREHRELARRHPDVAAGLLRAQKLELESRRLIHELEDLEDPDLRQVLVGELRQLLNEVFDLRLLEVEVRARELAAEKAELDNLLERRRQQKEKIVQHRIHRLVGEQDRSLEWW